MEDSSSALNSDEIQGFLASRFHDMNDFLIDLDRIRDGEEIFGEHRHSRMLFLENPGTDIGHFTLLTDFGDHIEYFDSRAGKPPQEILNLGKPVQGIRTALQGPTTYTCGKWCILRYLSLPSPLGEFCEIFLGKKMTPDNVVNILINLKVK